MQGFIRNGIVHKPGSPPEQMPCFPQCRHVGAYEYDFVDGRMATPNDYDEIVRTARDYLWVPQGKQVNMQPYVDHVNRVLKKLEIADNWLLQVLGYILTYRYEEVKHVHGDMTLENCIVKPDGRVMFIDPGRHYGAKCAELDRAKLLQSMVMRWEERRWDDPVDFVYHKSELALLVTHWIRLIPYWPNLPTRDGLRTLETLWSLTS